VGSSPTTCNRVYKLMRAFFLYLGRTNRAQTHKPLHNHLTVKVYFSTAPAALLPVNQETRVSFLKGTPSLFSQRRRSRFTGIRRTESGSTNGFFISNRSVSRPPISPALIYARRRVASLFRKGQRSQREHAVRSIGLVARPRGSISTANQRRNRFVSLNAPTSASATTLLRPLPVTLPPFVALRIRRRTKRAAPRIRHLTRLQGQRIALRNLAKALQRPSRRPRQASSGSGSSSTSASSLQVRLVRTLSALSTSSTNKASSSTLRERREEIHQQARKARPRS
jgi:hypothetical protein